jgi:O-antigen/teichoic acid export membrane protein
MGKFLKDTIFTFTANIIGFVLTLLSSVIVARALDPGGKGIYTMAALLTSLLVTFANPGIGPAAVYNIGKKKYIPSQALGNTIIFSILISALAVLVGLVTVVFFGNSLFPNIGQKYFLLALSLVPMYILFSSGTSVLLAFQEIKKYNLIILLQSAAYLLLAAIFLLGMHFGVGAAIIIEIISYGAAIFLLLRWDNKAANGISLKLSLPYLKDTMVYGAKTYLGTLFSFLRQRNDVFLINLFLAPAAVGLYSVARGVSEKIWMIAQSTGLVLFPRVSNETDPERLKQFTPLVSRNVLFVSLIAAAGIFIFSRLIILFLYSEAFSGSVAPLNVSLIGIVATSGIIALGNDFAGRGKPMINAYCNLFSLVVSVLLALLLIPRYGIEGAAWAFSISCALLFAVMVAVYSRISGNRIAQIIFIQRSDLEYYRLFFRKVAQGIKSRAHFMQKK